MTVMFPSTDISRMAALIRPISVIAAVCGLAALILLAGGCAPKISDRDIALVGPDEGLRVVEGRRRVIGDSRGAWVDARSPAEFREGHIPGAINLPLERARDEHQMLRDYDALVVYGNDFNSPRATALSKTLMELRHRNVHTLRGGLRAWKDAGHEVQRGD